MQLLLQSAMIFFGTLFTAGLLALAQPPAAPAATPVDNVAAQPPR